jgi:hypothetical protein
MDHRCVVHDVVVVVAGLVVHVALVLRAIEGRV